MIKVYNLASSEVLGSINEEQMEFLIEQLEEESSADDGYYIDSDTVDYLEGAGADEELLQLLRNAVGEEEGIEIYFEDEEAAAAG